MRHELCVSAIQLAQISRRKEASSPSPKLLMAQKGPKKPLAVRLSTNSNMIQPILIAINGRVASDHFQSLAHWLWKVGAPFYTNRGNLLAASPFIQNKPIAFVVIINKCRLNFCSRRQTSNLSKQHERFPFVRISKEIVRRCSANVNKRATELCMNSNAKQRASASDHSCAHSKHTKDITIIGVATATAAATISNRPRRYVACKTHMGRRAYFCQTTVIEL